MTEPIQPIVRDPAGVVRFRENRIVRDLLEEAPYDLNEIAVRQYSPEDRMQFAQLIGYSISGYADLQFVSDESYARVETLQIEYTCAGQGAA